MGLLLFFPNPGGTTPLIWSIKFRWDGVNFVDESAYVTGIDVDRGRDGPFDAITAGKCTLTLDNSSDRFNPWNSGGALYGHLTPGITVMVDVTYRSLDYSLFAGFIEDIVPSGKLGNKTVTITAYDEWRRVCARNIDLTLTTASTDNDTLIDNVLTAYGGWKGIYGTILQTQESTANFWANGTAGALIEGLVNSEMGYLRVGGEGSLVALPRDYAEATARTLTDSDLVDIELNQPWDCIVNKATVIAHPVDAEATADIWTLNDVTYIAPGASATVWAEFQDSFGAACAASGVIDPAATTDYTANSQANGGGTDMTASLTVTPTKYANRAKLVLANGHATTGLYVTLLKIRGDALHSYPVTVTSEDSTSQTAYGMRERTIDLYWLQDVNTAQDFANALVSFWKDPQKMPVIRMQRKLPLMIGQENGASSLPLDQFSCFRLTSTVYPITAEEFMVGKLHWWTRTTMQDLWAEFKLEAFDNRKFWDLGTTGFTELDLTTKLGY